MSKRGFIRLFVILFILLGFLLFAFLRSIGFIEITGYTTHDAFQINNTVLTKVEFSSTGEATPISGSFHRYDFVGCGISYLGDSNGINLSAGFYSPIRSQDSPDVFYSDLFNSSQDEIVCNTTQGACLVYYNVTDFVLGEWKCFSKFADTVVLSDDLEMLNSAPVFAGIIPDLSVDIDGEYINNFTLDLDNYFSDLEGDDLDYGAVGQLDVIISVDNWSLVSFNNPENFEGYETIRFRAHDGTSGTFSNNISVSVGSGIAREFDLCNSVWDCNWGPCINGQRTCEYFDRNNCGDASSKPDDLVESCDVELSVLQAQGSEPIQLTGTLDLEEPLISGSRRTLLMIGVAVFILLIVSLVVFLLHRQSKKRGSQVFNGIKQEQFTKPEIKQNVNQKNGKASNVFKLNKYIGDALNQGQSVQKIRSDLIHVGWQQKDVDSSINYVGLKKFVKSKLDSGFEKDKIVESLKAKGWKEDIINSIFKDLSK